MIETIQIAGIATYGAVPTALNGLSTFNYFYGANGSGKTTVSRLIADPAKHARCSVKWKNNAPLETLVYNRDFVDKHFRASSELPGIFTLGEKDAAILDKIAQTKGECDKLGNEIVILTRSLQGDDGAGGKLGELRVCDEVLRDACWKQKVEHDEALKMAFEGFRNSSDKFKAQVLKERGSNTAESKALDFILERAKTVFAEAIARIEPLATINGAPLAACEISPVLKKKVVGKSDVDIAAMIQRLGNSDWVKAGRPLLDVNDQKCPFCQQTVKASFVKSLEDYFDESFEADTKAIDDVIATYETHAKVIAGTLDTILASPPSLLDAAALSAKKKLFDSHVEINRQRLSEKKKEPSRVVNLQSSESLLSEISDIIEVANAAIAAHNTTVANLAKERATLKSQVWRHLFETALKDALTTYDTNCRDINAAVANLKKQIQEKQELKRKKEDEISDLERSTTSVQPTIDAINALLKSFGFHGFSLAQAGDKPCYKLIRADGTDAKETLSEGEKTFVTFLYFYHLLKGSASESGATADRVVVIDDPVSSLDSDILFVVSTLIRRLCEDVRTGAINIKQLFVLTHNVYFHKEVTFNKQRGDGKLKEETFWTVRKLGGESTISSHASNPIKSSYELLWQEVRERRQGNLSIQNSLRRILESYFKILGGIDLDKIHERFEGNEKLACRALMSWVNDGSHSAHDDLYVAVEDQTIDIYLEVFRKIFDGQGHIEHYNMMMASPPANGQAR